MSKLVAPHGGGEIRPLLVPEPERQALLDTATDMPKVKLGSKEMSDLVMLAMGAFTPLDGFLTEADYLEVVAGMRLANGVVWPIPVTLPVSSQKADEIGQGQDVALVAPESDEIVGVMTVADKYTYDKGAEAENVFRTADEAHPGVKRLMEQDDVYLGGRVRALSEGEYPAKFPELARPAETRAIFEERGWSTVAAFQTRNPIHRSHEYLTKIAMEVCDGVFIHPIVGALKEGDIPAETRMKCYQAILANHYPADRVVMKVYPMEMRYAGPREAILHAIIRQNFGCSHMIIGRDHAGVGNYYGPFDAQDIFDDIDTDDLEIRPLKLDWTFWCHKCGGMASMKTCPHGKEDRFMISGTELRRLLTEREPVPPEISRPEVAEILTDYYAGLDG